MARLPKRERSLQSRHHGLSEPASALARGRFCCSPAAPVVGRLMRPPGVGLIHWQSFRNCAIMPSYSTLPRLVFMGSVGLRELRQEAWELGRRAEGGEAIDISVFGRLAARMSLLDRRCGNAGPTSRDASTANRTRSRRRSCGGPPCPRAVHAPTANASTLCSLRPSKWLSTRSSLPSPSRQRRHGSVYGRLRYRSQIPARGRIASRGQPAQPVPQGKDESATYYRNPQGGVPQSPPGMAACFR